MLRGICQGFLQLPQGAFGRSLLGYQTIRALGTPPVSDADSLKTRVTPNFADGDIYIIGVATPYRFEVRQDGTYYLNTFGNQSRQLIAVAGYSLSNGLIGEGVLAINDDPPRPVGASLFGNAAFAFNQPVSVQLRATDLQGDPITFTVLSGVVPPGTTISSSGLWTGTPTSYGSFGFTVQLTDTYNASTNSVEIVTISRVLPDFLAVPQLIGAAEAAVTALGLTYSATAVPSSLPTGTVISQSPPAGTVITSAITVSFTYSNGALFILPPNVFPSNIPGLTFNSERVMQWKTRYQESLTGKVTTFATQKYPIVEWTLMFELLNQNSAAGDELKRIEGLFTAKQGTAGTFLYIDPAFNTVAAEPFGTGDGTKKAFQLVARYGNAAGPSLPEIVQSLQPSPALQVFDNGSLVSSSNYSVGPTGLVTFNSAPVSGHALTWTGAFYYVCRFETDDIDLDEFMYRLWELKTIKFRSVILA